VKDPLKRMKRKTTEWEKMFPNHICEKGLISKIYKELLKLNIKMLMSNLVGKQAEKHEETFY
jgi:hypothetical protein